MPCPVAGMMAGQAGTGGQGDGVKPPGISLPKGGGAIRGIDEKFGVNPAIGTPLAYVLGTSVEPWLSV